MNPAFIGDVAPNITIPVTAIGSIQESIISASVQGEMIFFITGIIVGLVVMYLYCRWERRISDHDAESFEMWSTFMKIWQEEQANEESPEERPGPVKDVR